MLRHGSGGFQGSPSSSTAARLSLSVMSCRSEHFGILYEIVVAEPA